MSFGGVTSSLSARGAYASRPDKLSKLWEIYSDVWQSEDNPGGVVNLGVAENALMHTELLDYINRNFHVNHHALTYGDGPIGSAKLRTTLAKFINRYFRAVTEVSAGQVIVTNGVSTANEACAWALCNPGDGILLGRPYYGTFPFDFGSRAGVHTVGVAFQDVDPFGSEAVFKYEEALLASEANGVKIKALMLCSPHNPLGRCYPKDVLIAIMKLCQKFNIHLISDEIYALSVWENDEAPEAEEFTSILSIDPTGIIEPGLLHVLWGLSKDFGANGLRVGCIISQSNPEFLLAVAKNSLFHYPSSASDAIAVTLLSDYTFVDDYVKTNRLRMAENYRTATAFLRENGIPHYTKCNAAFFLWIDLGTPFLQYRARESSNISSSNAPDTSGPTTIGEDIGARLLAKKVFIAAGDGFGGEIPGWFRMIFTVSKAQLKEGLTRMMEALQ